MEDVREELEGTGGRRTDQEPSWEVTQGIYSFFLSYSEVLISAVYSGDTLIFLKKGVV